jgi:hypothetical protein
VPIVVEDDERYLTVAEHTQLVGLFHQSKLSLCECDLFEARSTGETSLTPPLLLLSPPPE